MHSNNQTSDIYPRSLIQVPGELTQGFASLNVESFGSGANQANQATLNDGVPQSNSSSNDQTT